MSTVKEKVPNWVPHEKGEAAKYRKNPELYKAHFNAKKAQRLNEIQALEQTQEQKNQQQALMNQLREGQRRINANYERNGIMYPGMVKHESHPMVHDPVFKYHYGQTNNLYGGVKKTRKGRKPRKTRKMQKSNYFYVS